MIKTSGFVALGAVLGFAVVFSLVSRRPPEVIPPSWFSLPGEPVAVNDVPVGSWDEANKVLQVLVRESYYQHETTQRTGPRPPEARLGEYKVTYVSRGGGVFPSRGAPETVTIRAWLPVTVDYSRAYPTQLTRFELVRDASVD